MGHFVTRAKPELSYTSTGGMLAEQAQSLGLVSTAQKLRVAMQTHDSSALYDGHQGHPRLHSEFQASLGYMRLCLKRSGWGSPTHRTPGKAGLGKRLCLLPCSGLPVRGFGKQVFLGGFMCSLVIPYAEGH